jgi:hypothetical protein
MTKRLPGNYAPLGWRPERSFVQQVAAYQGTLEDLR